MSILFVDMLPIRLSSDLCSLRANELRYAFSVIWTLKEDASIETVKFTKSLIKSKAALSYQQAQIMVDNKDNSYVCFNCF